jgi:hypothetical protein
MHESLVQFPVISTMTKKSSKKVKLLEHGDLNYGSKSGDELEIGTQNSRWKRGN